jgi:SagB-type dehydrogenase family enzyme
MLGAQNLGVIKLETPDKSGGRPVGKVFANRQSVREFATDKLKAKDLSTLLWMANGVNRADGRRTAPSAMNAQDVDIYVVMPEGAYLYDAKAHALNPVAAGNFRDAAGGGQGNINQAPVFLLLVSDLSRLTRGNTAPDEQTRLFGALDAGIIAQNINIACSGLGLATVTRTTMDKEALKKALNLKDTQLLLLNNPVGYPKK